jgi:hypothetical protein
MSVSVFTQREIQLIIESLLYCASSEINHTKYHEDLIDSVQLAIKLRLENQNIPVSNVFFIKTDNIECPYTQEIVKFFPDLTNI